jgi:hypothetical protein
MPVKDEKLRELIAAWRANADKFDEAAARCRARSDIHSNSVAAMFEASRGDSCTNAAIALRKCADDLEALRAQHVCCRCYAETEVFPANCAEKPEDLRGQPIGMYHCPNCGAMVVAGVAHGPLCGPCLERKHPQFDATGGS